MPEGRLFIGNHRYSSWSMRGWLVVKLAGLDVEEVVIPLDGSGATRAVGRVSPSGLVPFLEHRGNQVWETLAIAEYCAEIAPALWPAETAARAHARSIAAEMHAGFRELRQAMAMNLGRDSPGSAARRARSPTSRASRRFGARRGSGSAPAARSCSAPPSPRPMRCTRRWWRAS
jgi:glutathione S-transferase